MKQQPPPLDTNNPHVMISLTNDEFELLFGEPYKHRTEITIGCWVTANDLRRGVGRWEKLNSPDPYDHEDRLGIIKNYQEISKKLSDEKDNLETALVEQCDATMNAETARDSHKRSYEIQQTNLDAKQKRIGELTDELKSEQKKVKAFEDWIQSLNKFQWFIGRFFFIFNGFTKK